MLLDYCIIAMGNNKLGVPSSYTSKKSLLTYDVRGLWLDLLPAPMNSMGAQSKIEFATAAAARRSSITMLYRKLYSSTQKPTSISSAKNIKAVCFVVSPRRLASCWSSRTRWHGTGPTRGDGVRPPCWLDTL